MTPYSGHSTNLVHLCRHSLIPGIKALNTIQTWPTRGLSFLIGLILLPFSCRNWCAFVQKRVVTMAVSCGSEKYIIKSQSPCPNGTPDCHLIMWVSSKPFYGVNPKCCKYKWYYTCFCYIGTRCLHGRCTERSRRSSPRSCGDVALVMVERTARILVLNGHMRSTDFNSIVALAYCSIKLQTLSKTDNVLL